MTTDSSLSGLAGTILLTAFCVYGCARHSVAPSPTATVAPLPVAVAPSPHGWTDVKEAAGVRFRHVSGASGRKYMPEPMGSGGAFLDFDSDGWLDLFFVNARPLPGSAGTGPALPKLLRNKGDGTFADVTAGSGLDRPIYGMGCAVGDYDGDGRCDIYVSACLDAHRLYRNLGGGRFHDVTTETSLGDRRWGTSCAWFDYDRDGYLDLFVCRYVRYRLGDSDRDCFAPDGSRMYCDPRRLPPDTCLLYRNEGGRRFRDVSAETGIAAHPGKALGVAVCDLDDDGWPDLLVANDTEPNFLFHNVSDQGSTRHRNPKSKIQNPELGRRFEEIALEAGVAMPDNGEPRAGMGIDVIDLQNDGRHAVLISNFSGEGLSLYQQDAPRRLMFVERAFEVGLGAESLNFLGFGLLFFDFDNDTRPDAFVANGHLQPEVHLQSAGLTYRQRNLLFRGAGEGRFEEVGRTLGGPMAREEVSRGAACGDFDNDGDLDLLIVNNDAPAELLRNEGGNRSHWLQLQLVGRSPNTAALGARVTVRAGGVVQRRTVRTGSSYLSQSMTRLHFGLGSVSRIDAIEIRWPDGVTVRHSGRPADQLVTIRQSPVRGLSG